MRTNREYWSERLLNAPDSEVWERIMAQYKAWLRNKCDDRKMKECVKSGDCRNCIVEWLDEEVEDAEE